MFWNVLTFVKTPKNRHTCNLLPPIPKFLVGLAPSQRVLSRFKIPQLGGGEREKQLGVKTQKVPCAYSGFLRHPVSPPFCLGWMFILDRINSVCLPERSTKNRHPEARGRRLCEEWAAGLRRKCSRRGVAEVEGRRYRRWTSSCCVILSLLQHLCPS